MKFGNLYGHTDGVNCLTYWNTVAASGSDDHTVRLWDLNTSSCISVIDGVFDKKITSICHNPRMTKRCTSPAETESSSLTFGICPPLSVPTTTFRCSSFLMSRI